MTEDEQKEARVMLDKLYGKGEYKGFDNFCYADPVFARSIETKYGMAPSKLDKHLKKLAKPKVCLDCGQPERYKKHARCYACFYKRNRENLAKNQHKPCACCKSAPRAKSCTYCSKCHTAKVQASKKKREKDAVPYFYSGRARQHREVNTRRMFVEKMQCSGDTFDVPVQGQDDGVPSSSVPEGTEVGSIATSRVRSLVVQRDGLFKRLQRWR